MPVSSFIASYYGRSDNRQIDWLTKQEIIASERTHGKIVVGGGRSMREAAAPDRGAAALFYSSVSMSWPK